MVYKAAGVVLLLLAVYLVAQSVAVVPPSDASHTVVHTLVAIFLVLVVRVLQAEKHQRDERTAKHPQRSITPQFQLGPADRLREQDSDQAHTLHAHEGAPRLYR